MITDEEREYIPNHEHLIAVLDRLVAAVETLQDEVQTLKRNARG